MPLPTPFHPRTAPLCVTYRWKDWAGYLAPCSYDISPDREYNAVRQAAGLLDVTPLFKYEVRGAHAGRFLSRILSRSVAKLKTGRMHYLCWCDDAGKIIDDGTCARLAKDRYRVTSALPSLQWFRRHARPFDVEIEDLTQRIAALALQGPTSRDILRRVCDLDMDKLRFFGIAETQFDGFRGHISRTGYTGDLGYELWVDAADALPLWDLLMAEGKDHGIMPIGLDTLDITRIEAGFVLNGCDYVSARSALTEAQTSTPFELGLGWTVKLAKRAPFVGQQALEAEKARGRRWALVGLDIDWPAVEEVFDGYGLPPHVPTAAWRCAIPVYHDGLQIGRATSGTWSPVLKKNLALATVEAEHSAPGTVLQFELTVEWTRHTVPATVVKTPFFDPERKRA